jgi:maltose-6'-phosphate glucosidase
MKQTTITIVGGGSTWSPGILKVLTKYASELNLAKVTLFDTNAERQTVVGEFAKILFAEEASQVEVGYTTSAAQAYVEADFVFCQMRTGGYAMRELDEKIPLAHGVVGQETCGPGGFAYGMRSIKDMVQMVHDIRSVAPNAWILNYTNPAAIVAVALQHYFPDDKKILNICDQPVNLMRSYARLLGKPDIKWEPRYFGLNHFGWFTKLYDAQGIDMIPAIKKLTAEGGFRPADAEQRDQSWLDTYAMVEDMLRDFPDYLPNTYLQYYLYPQYKATKLDPSFTRANEVMAGREKKVFAECADIVAKGSAKDSHLVHNDAHGEMIVELALSILHNKQETFIVIVPNNGIISNLSHDAMVEVAASVGINGAAPYAFGAIPTFYKGLIENQYAFEKLTVEAFVEQSYAKALQALTLNRTVVDAKLARKILDDLIIANKSYWPELR